MGRVETDDGIGCRVKRSLLVEDWCLVEKRIFRMLRDLVEFAGLVVGETLLHWELGSFVVT
jgi:hypothetical protein